VDLKYVWILKHWNQITKPIKNAKHKIEGWLENIYIIKGCRSNQPLPNWQKLHSWHKTKCQSCPDCAPLIMRSERWKLLAKKKITGL
jgi:hypothetical protein